MDDAELLYELAVFEIGEDAGLRAARRPAGPDLLVEYGVEESRRPKSLAAFWLASLWRFLEDSKQNPDAFEGLAFQAVAQSLSAAEFGASYGLLRARLTLPPPYPIELEEAYRTLHGRITSFVGVTTDGEFWAGFFQANVFELSASLHD